MNVNRARQALSTIENLTLALEWLNKYGDNLSPREIESHSFSLTIILNHGKACAGAKEAERQLSAVGRLHIKEIISSAINDAQNTLEMSRCALREETE
jgi:hypothetical protein